MPDQVGRVTAAARSEKYGGLFLLDGDDKCPGHKQSEPQLSPIDPVVGGGVDSNGARRLTKVGKSL